MSDEEFDFEEQIRLEKEEKLKAAKRRVDEDGTEYEWDEAKQAWFPKIDANFIAQYQMSYGNFEGSEKSEDSSTAHDVANIPPAPPVDHPGYYYWYYHIYLPSQKQDTSKTADKQGSVNSDETNGDKKDNEISENNKTSKESETNETYNTSEVLSNSNNDSEKAEKDKDSDKTDSEKSQEKSVAADSEGPEAEAGDEGKAAYEEYYRQYYDYYYGQSSEGAAHTDYWSQYYHQTDSQTDAQTEQASDNPEQNNEQTNDGKKAKKRRLQQKDQGWFEMDQNRNTSVYVTNLPSDITDEEFKELMSKCGLIAMDPVKHSLKLKLYRNQDGNVKGDGLCSYIKMESVELALDILDGYTLRGNSLTVEPAKFELKGAYDPSKKKKKLTNREKRKLKEKQEKLFDWKLEKGRGVRSNFEKTLVFKNVFDPADFDRDPTLVFKLRDKLKEECAKYGDVRKVVIYDRHVERVATAAFSEAEEADMCKEYMNNRYFNQRAISVETWDGKTKFTVQETAEEEQKRLQAWGSFLGGEDAATKTQATAQATTTQATTTTVTTQATAPTSTTSLISTSDAKAEAAMETETMPETTSEATSLT